MIAEIDTRALVRHLRSRGVMRGVLSATGEPMPTELVERARAIAVDGRTGSGHARLHAKALTTGISRCDALRRRRNCVATPPSDCFHVVAYDFGIKRNILRRLVQSGARVTVVPAGTTAEDVLALKPDGVFLSNGPGDPEPLEYQAAQVRKLIGKKPVFGICLGHQILGLALGGKTYKLKFGHRGANHPVLNKVTNKVEITSHNHGFAVDPDSLNVERDRNHPHQSERRDARRLPAPQPSGVLRAISSRGRARAARFALPVRRFREADERVREVARCRAATTSTAS